MALDGRRPTYACGKWQIDLDRRELRAHGVTIPLGGRAFDVIEVLVQTGGKLVTKDELMASVWQGTMVEDNTIQVHVSALRKAFGTDRDSLRTFSGRGYQLLGTWTAMPETMNAGVDIRRSTADPQPPRGNLPVPGSDLIGRAAAVRHLRDLLSAYRAVTVVGPGGIGKTRLALEVARGALSMFQDDIWFVELASLVDPALVTSAVTASLGLEVRGNTISPEAIARAIGRRKLLIVLDNCEHLIDATAQLATTLLRMCPAVTLLGTSRELMKIDGEYAYWLTPLDVPSLGSADIIECSAVQLFLARMRALSFNVAPHQEEMLLIAAICRRLDGIPLAIELAAARAATLGLEQVLSRLDDRFGLLTGGRRTALPRQQTLRATLDWSYELLPEPERRLLRRLAVFPSGCTLEAAAVVMGGIGSPPSIVVEGIVSLVSKSLLSLAGYDQCRRWRLLETTSSYALEKLKESGEAAEAARLHAEFFRCLIAPEGLATRLEPAASQSRIDVREIDNIRTALEWAFSSSGDAEIGIALTIGAVPLWVRLSLMGECRGWVERALASLGQDTADILRARMQLSAALGWSLMFAVGRAHETSAAWSTTLQLAEKLDDPSYRLRALWGLWVDHLNNGFFRKAAGLAQAFSSIVSESADVIDRMMADRMLATSLHFLGDQRNARRHIELMLGHYEMPALDPQILRFQFDQRVTAHYFQARILWLQGFADQAMRVVESNVQEAESVGNALSLGSVLGQGACPIALFTGDLAAAKHYGDMLLDHSERHALQLWQAWARAFNAIVIARQNDITDGLRLLRTEITAAGETRSLPRYLVLIGELAALLGRAGEADLGLETVDGALARCEANEEGWYVPELLRIRGELIMRVGGRNAVATAEAQFLRSLERAKYQGALSWELRSAINLARLRQDQGRLAEAHDHLSAVYGQFSEGFATSDLQTAKQLIFELI